MKRLIAFLLLLLIAIPAIAEESQSEEPTIPQVKASYSFGEKDENLISIKQRLRDLGYYSDGYVKDRIFTGYYDAPLYTRIRLFQAFNALSVTGDLDQTTLNMLFSDNALNEKAYYKQDESLIPNYWMVGIGDTSQYDFADGYVFIKTQVKNYFTDKNVVAFELKFIPHNAWYEEMPDIDNTHSVTTVLTLKPGEMKYSNSCAIFGYQQMFDVLIGISRFRLDDGTVVEVPPDKITYHSWRGPFRPQ